MTHHKTRASKDQKSPHWLRIRCLFLQTFLHPKGPESEKVTLIMAVSSYMLENNDYIIKNVKKCEKKCVLKMRLEKNVKQMYKNVKK